jgi:hypothetical protein
VTASLLEQLADLPKAEVDALIRAMALGEANAFQYDWRGFVTATKEVRIESQNWPRIMRL